MFKQTFIGIINKYHRLFFLFLSGLLLLPSHFIIPPKLFLDSSWMASINMAVINHLQFGTEYIFAYGPMGFLLTRCPIGISKFVFITYDLFIITNLLFIINYCLSKFNYINTIVIVIFSTFFLKESNCLLFIFLFHLFYFIENKTIFPIIAASIISLLSFFIKVNYGIALNFMFFSGLIYFFSKKIFKLRLLFFILIIHFLLLVFLSELLNTNLYHYVVSSLHIINSYNDAMFISIPYVFKEFQFALIIIIGYLLAAIIFFRTLIKNYNILFRYFLVALGLFIVFKNSFVRADIGHFPEFYAQNVLLIMLLVIFEAGRIQTYFRYLNIVSFIFSFSIFTLLNQSFGEKELKSVLPYYYINEIINYNTGYLEQDSLKRKIPDNILKKIGIAGVDIIPTELCYAFINKLNYRPRPIPQSYQAYNKFLDSKNADKYSSPNSPDYILYANSGINTCAFWEESITKRVLLTNYSIEDTLLLRGFHDWDDIMKKVILFKKKVVPNKLILISEKTQELELGKLYKIDSTSNLVYLFANVKYSFIGQLKRLLFQPPLLEILLKYEDGTINKFRVVIPILKTGILINKKINDTQQAYLFFKTTGVQCEKVIAYCFTTHDSWGFNKKIDIKLKTYTLK